MFITISALHMRPLARSRFALSTIDGMTLEHWRRGRLVGTVEQVREQVAHWSDLGVDTIVAGVGAVPFGITTADDVALLAHALDLALEPSGRSAG